MLSVNDCDGEPRVAVQIMEGCGLVTSQDGEDPPKEYQPGDR
jgi:hypothetical protein